MRVPLALLALLAPSLAGCATLDDASDPSASADPSTSPMAGTAPSSLVPPAGPWNFTLTAQPNLTGQGTPFQSTTILSGCDAYTFEVPAGTATLDLALEGAPDSPGTGYMTFMARPTDAPWLTPSPTTGPAALVAEAPNERTTLHVDGPAEGAWEVWVWPHGPVVDQAWDLTAALAGSGPFPPQGALEADC